MLRRSVSYTASRLARSAQIRSKIAPLRVSEGPVHMARGHIAAIFTASIAIGRGRPRRVGALAGDAGFLWGAAALPGGNGPLPI